MPESFGNLNELFMLDYANIDTNQSVQRFCIYIVSDKAGKIEMESKHIIFNWQYSSDHRLENRKSVT